METKKVKRFSMAMFFVAFALMIAAVFAMPAVVFAQDAPKSVSDKLTINYSQADYTIKDGSYIIIPSSNADSVVATATNAAKTQARIDNTDPAKPKMYLVGNVSGYSIVYSLTNADGNVSSETININLEQQDASFKFESNQKEIIPTVVQKEKENLVVFPYPFIYVGEDSDEAINVNAETGRPTDIAGLTVTLTSPKGKNIAIEKNADGYYQYQIKKDGDNESQLGKYTVRYTYKNVAAQTVIKTFNFTVKDGAVDQAIKIDKFDSALPSSMALFVETNLPKPVVVNTQNANAEVSAYSILYLEFTPADEANASSKTTYTNDLSKKGTEGYTYVSSLNDFRFTPEIAGTFTLTYKVNDFFGNEAQTSSEVNAITARKTGESGSGYIVEPYANFGDEKTLIESGNFKTAEYKIPSRVKLAQSTGEVLPADELWQLPAIFGIDKLTTDSSLLTYERIIRYTDSKNNSIKLTFSSAASQDQHTNAIYTESGTFKANANESIPFRFTEETEYTVEYVVRDIKGNTLFDSEQYTVSVEKDYEDTQDPTVKFEGLNTTTVVAGKVLKFKVSATDTESATSAVAADSRLEVTVTAKVGDAAEQEIFADEDGFYTFSTKEIANGTNVVIKAKATDDSAVGPGRSSEVSKTISVKVISGDNAPTVGDFNFDASWTVVSEELQPVYSGDTVTLPEITFTDANANKNLSVRITAKVDSNVVFDRTLNSGKELAFVTCGGEQFVVSRSGDYVVNYVATDVAGNKTVKSFVFEVIGPEATIINLGSFDSKYDFGTEIDVRNLTVTLQTNAGSEDITDECEFLTGISSTADDAEIRAAAQTAAGTGCAILCQIIGDYSLTDDESIIKAGQNGSVTINYWAVGHWADPTEFNRNFNATPSTVSFTVKDETSPTITVNESLIEDVVPYDKTLTGPYDNMVKIADVINVWDLAGIQEDSIKITAKYNTSTKDVDMIVINGKLETTNDVLYIGNNKVKIGPTEYTYDAAAGTLSDGTTTYTFVDNKVTIADVVYTFAPETDYYGYFKAGGNGTVTVTYTATDNNGNTATKTFSIVVGDITPPEINTTNVKADVQNANYKKDSTVSIDLTKLTILDDYSDLDYTDVKVTVTCNDKEVEIDTTDPTKVQFVAGDYGEYVISFNVQDDAGYSSGANVSFTISENSQGKTASSTTIWGTVLIVVILVALGIIIFLFAKPSKSKQTVKLTDKKTDDKKDK